MENENEASRRMKTEFLVQLDGCHVSNNKPDEFGNEKLNKDHPGWSILIKK